MKFLDKFFNNADIPWVNLTWTKLYSNNQTPPQARSPVGSFWWKDILKLFSKFQEMSICHSSKGNSVRFWSDSWDNEVLKDKYPQLYSFTRNAQMFHQLFLITRNGQIVQVTPFSTSCCTTRRNSDIYGLDSGMKMSMISGATLGVHKVQQQKGL